MVCRSSPSTFLEISRQKFNGHIEGFHDFLEAALVLGHKDRNETLAWSGGEFNVNKFDPQEVIFNDPQERWKAASLPK
jgi:hypothetical protein